MATLHVLSHSPFTDSRLSSCLRIIGPDDGVLLCGDAVYALQQDSALQQTLERMPDSIGLYALQEDLQARNIDAGKRANAIDYPEFVELSCRFAKVNSWL